MSRPEGSHMDHVSSIRKGLISSGHLRFRRYSLSLGPISCDACLSSVNSVLAIIGLGDKVVELCEDCLDDSIEVAETGCLSCNHSVLAYRNAKTGESLSIGNPPSAHHFSDHWVVDYDGLPRTHGFSSYFPYDLFSA